MNLILSLPPDTEALLKQQAAAAGAAPEDFALRALKAQLAVAAQGNGPPPDGPREQLTAEAWTADIRQWAESHRRLDHPADDSRESIYSGRGE